MNRLIIFVVAIASLLLAIVAYGATVAEYTKAIDESPDFSTSIQRRPSYDAFMRRGEMYFEKGAYNIAEDNFTAAIDLNPSIEAYKLRGVTYLVLGKLDMAVVDGTQIIKMAPNTSESYNIRMEAYAQIGEPKLAREDARRALSLDRSNRVASELLVRYPEKIEMTGAASRFRPKNDINKYRVWANNKGFAFSRKPEEGAIR